MKFSLKCAGRLLAVAVVLAMCGQAGAQLLKQVPKDATFVIKVNDLAATSGKIKDTAAKLGLADVNPAMADPLGFVKQQLNVKEGLKENGDLALVFFAPAGFGPPTGLGLIPVSDYKAFLGNFGQPTKEGDVDVLAVPNQTLYAMQWGDYAAVTNTKELLGKERGLDVSAEVAKLMQSHDATVFVNIKALRPLVLPQLQMIKNMMGRAAPPGAPNAQEMAAMQAMAKQVIGGIESLFEQCDATALGVNIVKSGMLMTAMADFAPDSAIAQTLKETKNSDADLLKGLPEAKYMMVAGWIQNGATFAKFVDSFYAPMLKALPVPEADAAKLDQALEAMKASVRAMNGGAVGLITPQADQIAATGVLHGIGVVHGDAKDMVTAQRKLGAVQDVFQKVASMGMGVTVNYKPEAKTVDGVALDETTMEYTFDPNKPGGVQQEKMIKAMFGAKVTSYGGMINDGNVVSAMNVDDQQIQALIAAVKQNLTISGNAQIKAASAELPQQRIAVIYIFAGQIGQLVAQLTGGNAPDGLADLPPIGMALSVEGSAIRFDAQISEDFAKMTVDLFKKLQGQRRGARGGQL